MHFVSMEDSGDHPPASVPGLGYIQHESWRRPYDLLPLRTHTHAPIHPHTHMNDVQGRETVGPLQAPGATNSMKVYESESANSLSCDVDMSV